MSRIKKLALALCVFCLAATFFATAYAAAPDVTEEFYVNDFAGVLTYLTKNNITSKSELLDEKYNVQIVVATVESTVGDHSSNFEFIFVMSLAFVLITFAVLYAIYYIVSFYKAIREQFEDRARDKQEEYREE